MKTSFLVRLLAVAALGTPALAFAGSPLICHPYAIGSAPTLPGSDGNWKGVNPNYDRRNLERDTLAVLTPSMPILVRMETLRRAAIYATAGMRGWENGDYTTDDRAVAASLLGKLQARVERATGEKRALALFDVGFFTETLRQTNLDKSLDGYATLLEALKLRGPDPEMEFALALAAARPRRPDFDGHVARARSTAKPGSLLAANLDSHFGKS
jgi:hypothetical protein